MFILRHVQCLFMDFSTVLAFLTSEIFADIEMSPFLTSEILSDIELGHCHSKNAKELKIDQISEWSNKQIARQERTSL